MLLRLACARLPRRISATRSPIREENEMTDPQPAKAS